MNSAVLQSSTTLIVRGILALIFGIVALVLPGPTLLALTIAFGAYAFVDGIFALSAAVTRRGRDARGWLAVEGIAGLITGIITFVHPVLTTLALIALVGAWALVTGIMKIVLAIRLRKEIRNEWLLVLGGIVSILLAGLIVVAPITATLALVWTIGVFALILGGLEIALSMRVRHWEQEAGGEAPARRAA